MTARFPQLIPIAKLVATILVVLAIIWHQEHSLESLRADLIAEIRGLGTSLTDAINGVEITPRTDLKGGETGLRAEVAELRAEVSENGQRLARIEGFLGIGIPDDPPQ